MEKSFRRITFLPCDEVGAPDGGGGGGGGGAAITSEAIVGLKGQKTRLNDWACWATMGSKSQESLAGQTSKIT